MSTGPVVIGRQEKMADRQSPGTSTHHTTVLGLTLPLQSGKRCSVLPGLNLIFPTHSSVHEGEGSTLTWRQSILAVLVSSLSE